MIIRMPDNWEKAEDLHNAFLNGLIEDFINSQPPVARLLASNLFLRSVRTLLVSSEKQDLDLAVEAFEAFKKN